MLDDSELRNKIVGILGLETAPNGEPDYLLIRDEHGVVLEGASYVEEVDQILALFQAHTNQKILEALATRITTDRKQLIARIREGMPEKEEFGEFDVDDPQSCQDAGFVDGHNLAINSFNSLLSEIEEGL